MQNEAGSLKIEKLLMTYVELSEAIGVCVARLKAWKQQGVIPYVKLGRSIRFDPVDVVKRLKKSGALNVTT